ncbi:MAG: ATP-dependent 6-phosphofructokinase [Steroidobacterales bacterium]
MPRLAVLTSGGDSPGMNAATRAVVRCAIFRGYEVIGIHHGYTGLIAGDFRPLGLRDVGGILHLGGTMLGTTRCETLKTERGCDDAMATLKRHDIASLIVIGGNGSQAGALKLYQRGAPVIGIASTIDNDLHGTDITIGATTAVDVALESIDRLRVTASSMKRAFLVEVMGRNCGYLAVIAGIAGGAEAVVVPEVEVEPHQLAVELRAAYARGKSHAIIIVAEGAKYNADALMHYFNGHQERLGFELRMTKLGHVQRGGAPGVFDRMLGTLLGAAAVDAAAAGNFGILSGMRDGKPASTALDQVAQRTKPADVRLLDLARILAM